MSLRACDPRGRGGRRERPSAREGRHARLAVMSSGRAHPYAFLAFLSDFGAEGGRLGAPQLTMTTCNEHRRREGERCADFDETPHDQGEESRRR